MKSKLFSPLLIRDIHLKNRIAVAPMCTYSAQDGVANQWHLVHLGTRAVGGAGLIIAEATGVSPEGRISDGCLGLWNDTQLEAFKPITEFILQQGAVPGIQLAHAGRKGSCSVAWKGGKPLTASAGGWQVIAPSELAFSESYPKPHSMENNDIQKLIEDFKNASLRAVKAGFQVIELHMAHGYLMHQFLSPLSNLREDQYGGSLENRLRLPLQIAQEVRQILPPQFPLFARISATDWVEGGWDLEQSLSLVHGLKKCGVDLIDCSTGGLVPSQNIPAAPSFQVPFAQEIRKRSEILTGAVGLITDPLIAEEILNLGKADIILLGREMLRNPYWPLQAAELLSENIIWPVQYVRAK